MKVLNIEGNFFLRMLFNDAASLPPPQIPLCRDDAGIEPRTVATLALTARHADKNFKINLSINAGRAAGTPTPLCANQLIK
jgi:hypothetical protein